MAAMNINAKIYVVAATTASASVTLTAADALNTSVLITNDSTDDLFVASSNAALTAVYPTSASVPVNGNIIPANTTRAFTKNPGDNVISCIRQAGTGNMSVAVGYGE